MKKIAFLNSGGNSTSSNIVLSHLVKSLNGYADFYAVKYGYRGLVENLFFQIEEKDLLGIENLGYIFVKTSRSNEFMTKKGIKKAVENLKKNNIDIVVITGGNGSFNGAKTLVDNKIKTLIIPNTIDNDLGFTDFSLGFHTAVDNAVDAVKKIHYALSNDDRGAIVETMGRDCGDITKFVSLKTDANYFITSYEEPKELCVKAKIIIDCGTESPLIIVKEHLYDIDSLANILTEYTGKVFKSAVIGYIQRGGVPDEFDKLLALQFVNKIVELIKKESYNRAVGIKEGKIFDILIKNATEVKK